VHFYRAKKNHLGAHGVQFGARGGRQKKPFAAQDLVGGAMGGAAWCLFVVR